MFYGLATNHEYWEEKINLFVALAPVVKMDNTNSSFIRNIAKVGGFLEKGYKMFNTPEIFQRGKKYLKERTFCRFIPLCGMVSSFLDSVLNPF